MICFLEIVEQVNRAILCDQQVPRPAVRHQDKTSLEVVSLHLLKDRKKLWIQEAASCSRVSINNRHQRIKEDCTTTETVILKYFSTLPEIRLSY